uniref:ZP domain-containing protein n=1 Tax=Setaria digitata TaxID=48799 RepID=A0A915PE01_9BILA
MQLFNPNDTAVIVLSTDDAIPHLIKELVKGENRNYFNVTTVEKDQVANYFAERIRTISKEKLTFYETSTAVSETELIRGFNAQCLRNGFNVTVMLLQSFNGIIAIRGKEEMEKCSKKIMQDGQQFDENVKTYEVNLFIDFEKCDIKGTDSVNQSGINYSTVINVMHDKSLVSAAADIGFLMQCYQSYQSDKQDLIPNMTLYDDIKIISLKPVPPLCKYSIRRDSPNGSMIQSAELGDNIYHRWECEENHRLCSTNQKIANDIVYVDDKLIAYSYGQVFELNNSEQFTFHCELTLCIRRGDGCEGITPPICPQNDHQDLLVYRRNHHNIQSFLAALTIEARAELILVQPMNGTDLALSSQIIRQLANSNLFWLMIILTALAVIVLLMLIRLEF